MTRTICLMFLGACLSFFAGEVHAADMASYREVFESESRRLDDELARSISDAVAQYGKHLQSLLAYMEKKGDDFGVRPVNAEMSRFERTKSIPEESAPGTPDLIKKARTLYYEAVLKSQTAKAEKMQVLALRYGVHLQGLRTAYKAAGNSKGLAEIDAELARIKGWADGDLHGGLADVADNVFNVDEPPVPEGLDDRLELSYVFDKKDEKVLDRSGRRHHAKAIRTVFVPASRGDRPGLRFASSQGMLEVGNVTLGNMWSVSATVKFPLSNAGSDRVLLSSGFRRHHVVVDRSGELGTCPGAFSGSGFKVSELNGWHRLGIVSAMGKTAFYVDGELVGGTKAACTDPVLIIGNDELGRQQWGGVIADISIWRRALSSENMKKLCSK